MTKREMFVAIGEVAEVKANAEMSKFIAKQIEMLDNRKNSKSSKPIAKQIENSKLKDKILAMLGENERMTCGEIAKALDITSQKCSALLTQLGEGDKGSHEVVKNMEKKIAYFSLAEQVG